MEPRSPRNPVRLSKNHCCAGLNAQCGHVVGYSYSCTPHKKLISDRSFLIDRGDCSENEVIVENINSSNGDGTRGRRANDCSLRRLTLTSKPPPVSSEAETSTGSDVTERRQLECCMAHLPRCKSVCGRHYEEAKSFISCRDSALDLRVSSSESRQTHHCLHPIARERSSYESGSSASKRPPIDSSIAQRVPHPQRVDSSCNCLRHLSVHSSCTIRERMIRSLEPCCAALPPEKISGIQDAEWREHHFHGRAEGGKALLAGKRNQYRQLGDGGHRGLPGCKRLGKTLENLPEVQECCVKEVVSSDRMRRRHHHPECARREASSSDVEARRSSTHSKQTNWERSERLSKILESKYGQSLDSLKPNNCSSGSRNDVGSTLTLLDPQKARVYATERVLEHVINGSRELYARDTAVAGHMHVIESPINQKEEIFLCAQTGTTSTLQIPEKFQLLGHKKISAERKTRCAISAESEQCLKGVYQRSLATFKMLESKDRKQKNKRFAKPLIMRKSSSLAPTNRQEFHSHSNPPLPVR